MESIKQLWNDTMDIPEARWVVWTTILVIAVVVAVYFAKMFRDMATGDRGISTGNLLSDFEQLRDQGKIDDHEFKRLKSTIRNGLDETNTANEKTPDEPSSTEAVEDD